MTKLVAELINKMLLKNLKWPNVSTFIIMDMNQPKPLDINKINPAVISLLPMTFFIFLLRPVRLR